MHQMGIMCVCVCIIFYLFINFQLCKKLMITQYDMIQYMEK